MTVRNCIPARDLRADLERLGACAEHAPEGTYTEAKAVNALVTDVLGDLAVAMEGLGLKFDGADACEEVAGVLYGFIKASNPEAHSLVVAEGFGRTMLEGSDEVRQRVIDQAASNLESYRKVFASVPGTLRRLREGG